MHQSWVYSVIGAAAMLGGVTRMTGELGRLIIDSGQPDNPQVSLVVTLFEMTGALSHVLPIIVPVIFSE